MNDDFGRAHDDGPRRGHNHRARMRRMNGFDLVRWVRSQPELAQLPIVIHSDSFVKDVEEICKGLGANHYIRKAHNYAALKEFVRTYIAAHGLLADPAGADESPRDRK